MAKDKVKDCFKSAIKDEEKGKKHKGLLIVEKNNQKAEEYAKKAKTNLLLCELSWKSLDIRYQSLKYLV